MTVTHDCFERGYLEFQYISVAFLISPCVLVKLSQPVRCQKRCLFVMIVLLNKKWILRENGIEFHQINWIQTWNFRQQNGSLPKIEFYQFINGIDTIGVFRWKLRKEEIIKEYFFQFVTIPNIYLQDQFYQWKLKEADFLAEGLYVTKTIKWS